MFGNKKKLKSKINSRIDPEDVLLDSFNLPDFDTIQFEGRVEKSIKGFVPNIVGVFATLILLIFVVQSFKLQIYQGEALTIISQKNRLDKEVVFSERGVIYDRKGRELAWNEMGIQKNNSVTHNTYALRKYSSKEGLSHLLGFIGYPKKDNQGYWWRLDYIGKAGIERSMNKLLSGKNGSRIIEVDALNEIQSENVFQKPVDGQNIELSIDSDIQEAMFKAIRDGAETSNFIGGAGIIMDINTGEILALTSYPEYDSQVMTDATNNSKINSYSNNENQPFLNRAVLGEYAPGSIVKPFMAAAALSEGIINPSKKILSTGELRIPNPYDPENDSVFKDWKAHGWINMIQALSKSSNVYFYTVGGGYGDQEGLGINRIAEYASKFGLGIPTGINFATEATGVVPTPAWKRANFENDKIWRLGDTYHTSIGQFGFLMTPIQAIRYVSAVGNGGKLLTPHIIKGELSKNTMIGISDEYLKISRRGMRASVTDGVAWPANVNGINIASKTGTAQVGVNNEYMNSWAIGFWPYEDPKFAFSFVFEKGPAGTNYGALPIMRSFFKWMVLEHPDYAKGKYEL